ncbi:MAG: Gfo/Idh/MocA family protein [Capsulimonadaceae bacterium]
MSESPFRWGILGLGHIAGKFAAGLAYTPCPQLAAVASRSQTKAEAFAAQHHAVRAYGSYQSLIDDPGVDAVYIATPHPWHAENALACIAAGKAVLCEKPFAMNAREAAQVVAAARESGVFVMEAMWTRFLPIMQRVRSFINEGAIGEVKLLQADFGFRAQIDPKSRLFDPRLGGGALLDVGVYPLSLASMILGAPTEISGTAELSEDGVDILDTILLRYAGGGVAQLATALTLDTPGEAHIIGTEGRMDMTSGWWKGSTLTMRHGARSELVACPFEGNGYNYEACELQHLLGDGRLESPVMPLDETVEILKVMDTLRAQWGVKYPADHPVV